MSIRSSPRPTSCSRATARSSSGRRRSPRSAEPSAKTTSSTPATSSRARPGPGSPTRSSPGPRASRTSSSARGRPATSRTTRARTRSTGAASGFGLASSTSSITTASLTTESGRAVGFASMGRAMATQVEELSDNRVRLRVEVPQADLQHAVEHATSDLARAVKVPGFRKGKVPTQVLEARVGRERIFSEAVESHIGGWFVNAAAASRIRPVAAPEYDYDVPDSEDDAFSFTATVAVQPKPEPADWTQLEVPYVEPEVPAEVVDQELEELRASVAELTPVEDRPARTGDVAVIDAFDESGDGQRDLVVELGTGRLLEELERALIGSSPGETKELELEQPDGSIPKATVTRKELKEKVLPPLDDELSRAASEFDTLDELRGDIERRIREVLEEE